MSTTRVATHLITLYGIGSSTSLGAIRAVVDTTSNDAARKRRIVTSIVRQVTA